MTKTINSVITSHIKDLLSKSEAFQVDWNLVDYPNKQFLKLFPYSTGQVIYCHCDHILIAINKRKNFFNCLTSTATYKIAAYKTSGRDSYDTHGGFSTSDLDLTKADCSLTDQKFCKMAFNTAIKSKLNINNQLEITKAEELFKENKNFENLQVYKQLAYNRLKGIGLTQNQIENIDWFKAKEFLENLSVFGILENE